MTSNAESPLAYIEQLPDERKEAVSKLRATIKTNLPEGFEECMGYGMLAYVVPQSIYPDGYHCNPKLPLPFINLASQKNFIALYHSGIYASKELYNWLLAAYPKHCKRKIDMGKSCIRFKNINDIPYDLIGELCAKITVAQWIELYEKNIKK
tara:strand:- start:140061 stop:140516 length:456 start_codon:yes stop_codon:yes gene_type:complete